MRFYWKEGLRQNSLFRWSWTMTITSCPQWIMNEVEQWGIDQRIDQNGLFDYDKNRFQSVKNDFILYNAAKLFYLKEYCQAVLSLSMNNRNKSKKKGWNSSDNHQLIQSSIVALLFVVRIAFNHDSDTDNVTSESLIGRNMPQTTKNKRFVFFIWHSIWNLKFI